jgi:hypothetical protein
MAKINLDNLVKTLTAGNTAKQDRIAASGNLVAMRVPPAVLSHSWRCVSPGSQTEPEPSSQSTIGVATLTGLTAKRAGRPTASRSGFPATSRTSSKPFSVFQTDDRHDCQSDVCRETRQDGLPGYQPGRGTAPAYSNGK